MPPIPPHLQDPSHTVRVRTTLERYDEVLLRQVVQKLLRPRSQWPVEELIDRSVETLGNAPVLDRRIKELPPVCRKLLAIFGLTRRNQWRVGQLLTLSATLGHPEGLLPITTLLEAGLLFPEVFPQSGKIKTFEEWIGSHGFMHAQVFAHPYTSSRCRPESWDLPVFDPPEDTMGLTVRMADGLEWPLRIGAVWQQILPTPLRLTQQNTLFKRDLTRMQADPVLNAPFLDLPADVTDTAWAALEMARNSDLLAQHEGELRAQPFPPVWDQGIIPTLISLWSALFAIDDWDPLVGVLVDIEKPRCMPSMAAAVFLLLAQQPQGQWTAPLTLAEWIWERHPAWKSSVEATDDQGESWMQAFLLGLIYQLQLIELTYAGDSPLVRLSPLARHLLRGEPEPPGPAEFRQTLMVQPNNEIIVFRQGLTTKLMSRLSRFAVWKSLSAACTLELTAEQVYLGLESGLSRPDIIQTLQQHGMRPVPATVLDAIDRWSNKRERVSLYTSATLLEFNSPEDLEAAIRRGLVVERLTDRIGVIPGDQALDMKQFRQIGNRDYESRPQRCIHFDDDGVSFTVDATQSDLLLEAELSRLAESLGTSTVTHRRYQLTVNSLRQAVAEGLTLIDLEQWFVDRTGLAIPPAARLLYPMRLTPPPAQVAMRMVLHLVSQEVTDGIWQWPDSRQYLEERIGPSAVVVAADSLNLLRAVLEPIGIHIEEWQPRETA